LVARRNFKYCGAFRLLWQNGLLGYVDESGRRRFYSMGDIEQFHFPPEVGTYVLHPCLVHTVGGIRHVPADSTGPGEAHTKMRRSHLLSDREGYLYTRYVKED